MAISGKFWRMKLDFKNGEIKISFRVTKLRLILKNGNRPELFPNFAE